MEQIVKKYTRDNVTIIWKPDQCIHATKCWKGLVEVFNPRKKPWVDMNGADLQTIIDQVAQCPSGALSCEITEEKEEADTQTEMNTSVEVLKNGPLMVYGNLKVKDSNGNESSRSKVTAFCRCGASANKPFCDGSHMRIGFSDE